MGMTYVQKLLAKACGRDTVAVGDILELPRWSLTSSRRYTGAPHWMRMYGILRGLQLFLITVYPRSHQKLQPITKGPVSSLHIRELQNSTMYVVMSVVSAIRFCPKTDMCGPARYWWARTAIPPPTGRSVPLHLALARRRWRRSGRWVVF